MQLFFQMLLDFYILCNAEKIILKCGLSGQCFCNHYLVIFIVKTLIQPLVQLITHYYYHYYYFYLQESSKISDLNPNAKAWANYMPKPEASATTCPDSQQSWVDAADDPSNCISGGKPPKIISLQLLI